MIRPVLNVVKITHVVNVHQHSRFSFKNHCVYIVVFNFSFIIFHTFFLFTWLLSMQYFWHEVDFSCVMCLTRGGLWMHLLQRPTKQGRSYELKRQRRCLNSSFQRFYAAFGRLWTLRNCFKAWEQRAEAVHCSDFTVAIYSRSEKWQKCARQRIFFSLLRLLTCQQMKTPAL